MLTNLIHHSTHNILPAQSTVVDFEFTWVPLIWTQYFACTQNSGLFWITWVPFILSLMNYTAHAAEMFGGSDFWLETRVIIKISTHSWYPRTFDWFSWKWSKFFLIFFSFFASFSWKQVKVYWLARMGRNYDAYPGFQPKITPPKHFSRECT